MILLSNKLESNFSCLFKIKKQKGNLETRPQKSFLFVCFKVSYSNKLQLPSPSPQYLHLWCTWNSTLISFLFYHKSFLCLKLLPIPLSHKKCMYNFKRDLLMTLNSFNMSQQRNIFFTFFLLCHGIFLLLFIYLQYIIKFYPFYR